MSKGRQNSQTSNELGSQSQAELCGSILIAGLAKSGTTALFYKIREVMPSDTLCLFEPKSFDSAAAEGRKAVLAKVLLMGAEPEAFSHFNKKILIVRDPRDRMVSSALYRAFNSPEFCRDEDKVKKLVDLLKRKEASPRSVPTLELIRMGDRLTGDPHLPRVENALKRLVSFRKAHPDFFLFRYENLVRANFDELSRYLGWSLSNEKPVVATEVKRVARKQDSGDWQDWFIPEDVEYFRPLLDPYMRELGYDDEWELAENPRITPEYSSAYVMQIVKERIAFDEQLSAKAKATLAKSKASPAKPQAGLFVRGAASWRKAWQRLMG
jgi:hypothetical protein